ncbi:MAG: IclR family transcriptional regulator [Spirochaetes bacterium]|nr:MAG: IclR family transcriptional regulator [Spirochaetota bacterium]
MAQTTIQSLDRGIQILRIIGGAESPLSLSEISAHFALDRSTVFRLVGTLVKHGLVHQDDGSKRYSLGARIIELSGAFGEQAHLDRVQPLLRRICAETHQNAHLALLDRAEVVFVAVEQPRRGMSIHVPVGTREPAFCTALGKALLAFLGKKELARALAATKWTRYTRKTIGTLEKLKKELATVRTLGLAKDIEEYRTGIVCYAAPVRDRRGEVRYSIGISGQCDIMRPHAKLYSGIIRDAGREASLMLGAADPEN